VININAISIHFVPGDIYSSLQTVIW